MFPRLWTNIVYQLRHYLNHCGKDMYADWLRRQRDSTARLAVIRRILRVATGNLGDHRFCRDGVWELRIDVGPGYRVYYALSGPHLILLLCAGDKRTQSHDIDQACLYWRDWKEREHERQRA